MRFLHGKIKARKGNVIRVNFSEPTRVLFMLENDFIRYKNNQTFSYFGGQKEESPVDFVTPKASTWYVVVEKGPYYEPKDVTASFSLVQAQRSLEAEHTDTSHIHKFTGESEDEDSE